MSSQTRCAIASFLAVETLDSLFSRIQIQKIHINAGSRCDSFLSNENKVMRFPKLHPPAITIVYDKKLQLTSALCKDRTHFVSVIERFISSNLLVYLENSHCLQYLS